ncbi:gamma-glutamyltransferase family protein [Salinicola corii]|uniref:Gamma-glutamyltransferase family protein n=1 Tax=Salinicola corii TaxID=2606937 RepID=A0A640WB52_9GAMM|nr:gamma-glutamyltransferase family protein [Salinicola corii]KAA0017472.1 gamma-glutamyltransferase family protein [Salinicola corii]
MTQDPLYYPFPSQRNVTLGRRGMVATSQSLASQAGLDILKQGGNAIDAAIATAAALTVVEPTSNGIGSDAFAIVWIDGKLYGLNASGPAPRSLTLEAVQALGHESMPAYGWVPVTVPGTPAGWAALSKRFGKLPFAELFRPAIEIAEQGYAITPTLHQMWAEAFEIYSVDEAAVFESWHATFAPRGRAPQIGEIWQAPDHAETLRKIADSHAEAFYQGGLAGRMADHAAAHGGFLTREDLAGYRPEWVEPVGVRYRDHDIWEIPPNGSGMIALMGLNILAGFDPDRAEVETLHRRIEALKLAYIDGFHYISEQTHMHVDVEALLSTSYADSRRALIGERALLPAPGELPRGGTVYLATADSEGNMVSFIQSNYKGFGSGVVVPGTGISLQNRGWSFSLDPNHVNALVPGKRPYHTIIPGFITRGDQAIGPFGVMGGFMQPQGHMQVITSLLDDHLNPQAALDAPRWKWVSQRKIEVEPHFPNHLVQALERRGHQVIKRTDGLTFGRGQIILRDLETGVLTGGTEPRTDGAVVSW